MFDYKDYPLELRISRATVLKARMILEQIQNNRNNHKWLRYTNSTRTRFHFATWIVHSFYSNRAITPAIITAEMGVSRKAINEIVSVWEAEGWLYKEKGTGIDVHKVFLHPSDEIIHINDEWFQWYESTILPMIVKSFNLLQSSTVDRSELQYDSQFNSTSSTNLSGIEDNVASFILKSSKKQRGKG